MTCIVGIVDEGNVYIGGDRSASDDSSIVSLAMPKVYIRDEWIFGYSGSLGIGQIMQIIDMPILEKNDDPFIVLRMDIANAFKNMLETQGLSLNDDNDTSFLIGCRGRLFEFSPADCSVAEIKETAIGSGGNFALGSLHTSNNSYSNNTHIRISMAIEAAITYSPSCQGPIDILYL